MFRHNLQVKQVAVQVNEYQFGVSSVNFLISEFSQFDNSDF